MSEQEQAGASAAQFIERMGLYFEEFGLPRIGGRLLGLLMVADRPLSLDEVARRLLVSRASVSTNARLVLATRLVERVSLPGDRRDYYAFSAHAWDSIIEVDLSGVRTLRDYSSEALAGLGETETGARQQLTAAIAFFDFYSDELTATLARWRARERTMQPAAGDSAGTPATPAKSGGGERSAGRIGGRIGNARQQRR